jgi:hypothetical protein
VTQWAQRRRQQRLDSLADLENDPTSRAYMAAMAAGADQLGWAGHQGAAIPLYREVLNHPALTGRDRATVACTLGWVLLHRHEDDPVPDEARRMCAVAVDELPGHPYTRLLRAYLLAYDGDGAASLREASKVRLRKWPDLQAHVRCVEAIACAGLGQLERATELRAEAARLDSECDVLPWADEAIAAAR